MNKLIAPFPYFGGKSRAAETIWGRFGNVPNMVEPFFGSGAVLLARPHKNIGTETVNDKDGYLVNFWRAIKTDPSGTAKHADYPVSECDLLARHKWLFNNAPVIVEKLKTEPDYFNVKVAGWWVWGLCSWIGSGWCVNESEPHLGDAGRGINRKLPHLGNAGRGNQIEAYFQALSDRLRDVRIACGDWTRIMTPACTTKHGVTGVLLDPPYTEGDLQYSAGGAGGDVADAVRKWAIANGDNRLLRIALCGYAGEHDMPAGWKPVLWNARKGYQSKDKALKDRKRETIWFSKHCINNRLL